MKRKRLLCAVMALVLLFSVQPAALASNATNQRSTKITASCKLPVIRVIVPSRNTVYINPLKLPLAIGGDESEDQIVSAPSNVANMSDVAIELSVSLLTGIKTGSTMTLASAPTGGSGTEKQAFVYFEIQQSNSDDVDDVTWDPAYDASKHVALIPGVPQVYPSTLTLPAKNQDGEVAEGGYAPFRLSGDAVKTPTDAWSSKDGINVLVTFTFEPIPFTS